MNRIVKRPQVYQDLARLSSHIAQQSQKTALRFLTAAEQTFADLANMPEAASPCDVIRQDLAGVRFRHVRGFRKHLIFFRALAGGIEVVRVIHASQDLVTLLGDDD